MNSHRKSQAQGEVKDGLMSVGHEIHVISVQYGVYLLLSHNASLTQETGEFLPSKMASYSAGRCKGKRNGKRFDLC